MKMKMYVQVNGPPMPFDVIARIATLQHHFPPQRFDFADLKPLLEAD
jgi:hypothetical protein